MLIDSTAYRRALDRLELPVPPGRTVASVAVDGAPAAAGDGRIVHGDEHVRIGGITSAASIHVAVVYEADVPVSRGAP